MKVFKFGGASVATADGVRNVAQILKPYGSDQLLVVISAMGKVTNLLEALLAAVRNDGQSRELYEELRSYHRDIALALFEDPQHPIFFELETEFYNLMTTFKHKDEDYDYHYDMMVGMGEILSTRIVSAYLKHIGQANTWLDVRNFIRTDSTFREAKVDWPETEFVIRTELKEKFKTQGCMITQGFIGADHKGRMVTLGREGSDYSAAIFAYALQAESMTIWKDVPGFLNADPRYFANATKLESISYTEAIELAYFGASIIHPKTIKPLQNSKIPLYVKSFIHPEASGSVIQETVETPEKTPCFICKPKQVLLSIYPKDFSFIAEQNLSYIFFLFAEYGVKINLLQNSAISFTVCMDENVHTFEELLTALSSKFKVLYNTDLELVTVRNYREGDIQELSGTRRILMEQRNRVTAQLVLEGQRERIV